MVKVSICPVILCGGSGTRLWPLSRETYPKQYISLSSKNEHSLFQNTEVVKLNYKVITKPFINNFFKMIIYNIDVKCNIKIFY